MNRRRSKVAFVGAVWPSAIGSSYTVERRSTRCDNQIRVCPEFSTFIQSESEKVHRRTDKERGSRDKDTASLESTVIIRAKLQHMKRSNPRESLKKSVCWVLDSKVCKAESEDVDQDLTGVTSVRVINR